MFAMDVSTNDRILVDGRPFQPGEIETAGGITHMTDIDGNHVQLRYNDRVILVCACGLPAISDRSLGGYGMCIGCFDRACFGLVEKE